MSNGIIHIQKWPGTYLPSETELRQLLAEEGLEPHLWKNQPGHVYNIHTHEYHKVMFVVSGAITFGFQVEGEPSTLTQGDRLDLPAGVAHNAVVGPDGVVCLEAHKQ